MEKDIYCITNTIKTLVYDRNKKEVPTVYLLWLQEEEQSVFSLCSWVSEWMSCSSGGSYFLSHKTTALIST